MIVDTNGFSALADGDEAAGRMVVGVYRLAIPAIVLGEYRFGIAQSRRRKEYENWLENDVLPVSRVLDITAETAIWYARTRLELKQAGRPIPQNDIWIAALCRQWAMPLLSRDHHFDSVPGLTRLEW